jgi:hypothetical protein
MNREDISKLSAEAMVERASGFREFDAYLFANLVAAHEREACAELCESTTASWTQHVYNEGCIDCAKAIRARGVSGESSKS